MYEAKLYSKQKDQSVQCHVCARECTISEGQKGFCQTRLNQAGTLYSLVYGRLTGIQVDPIEKKPLYHFYPGSLVASTGSYGCNFRCKQCLNFHMTYLYNFSNLQDELTISPKDFIRGVKESGFQGVAFTYNEPTIWLEYIEEAAQLARQNHLYTVLVTNGYQTEQSLDFVGPHIQGYSVDFKGFSKESLKRQGNVIDYQQVAKMTKRAQEKWGMKVEITTLIIPGINDNLTELKKMALWIKDNLGANTPWHLSQFSPDLSPDHTFQSLPETDPYFLEKVYTIGKKQGLNFVFVYASGAKFSISNSVCPSCGHILIKRRAWQVVEIHLDQKGKCDHCGYDPGIWL